MIRKIEIWIFKKRLEKLVRSNKDYWTKIEIVLKKMLKILRELK